MPKLIHVNINVIRGNAKNGTNYPVCRVQDGSETRYAHRVEILGPSTLVYSPDQPLPCGAKVWIETDASVRMFTSAGTEGHSSYCEAHA